MARQRDISSSSSFGDVTDRKRLSTKTGHKEGSPCGISQGTQVVVNRGIPQSTKLVRGLGSHTTSTTADSPFEPGLQANTPPMTMELFVNQMQELRTNLKPLSDILKWFWKFSRWDNIKQNLVIIFLINFLYYQLTPVILFGILCLFSAAVATISASDRQRPSKKIWPPLQETQHEVGHRLDCTSTSEVSAQQDLPSAPTHDGQLCQSSVNSASMHTKRCRKEVIKDFQDSMLIIYNMASTTNYFVSQVILLLRWTNVWASFTACCSILGLIMLVLVTNNSSAVLLNIVLLHQLPFKLYQIHSMISTPIPDEVFLEPEVPSNVIEFSESVQESQKSDAKADSDEAMERDTTRTKAASTSRSKEQSCQGCDASFGYILKRRHYCRHCGDHFCWSCCNKFLPRSFFGATAPAAKTETVNVCHTCFVFLQRAAADVVTTGAAGVVATGPASANCPTSEGAPPGVAASTGAVTAEISSVVSGTMLNDTNELEIAKSGASLLIN